MLYLEYSRRNGRHSLLRPLLALSHPAVESFPEICHLAFPTIVSHVLMRFKFHTSVHNQPSWKTGAARNYCCYTSSYLASLAATRIHHITVCFARRSWLAGLFFPHPDGVAWTHLSCTSATYICYECYACRLQVFALLEGDYSLSVTRVNVLEGEDSEKKIKQMKTFSGANTVPQVRGCGVIHMSFAFGFCSRQGV